MQHVVSTKVDLALMHRLRARAADAGISVAAYVRRLIVRDVREGER